jgi:hypothetical protein
MRAGWMINRALSKRLERLETRLASEGEPLLIQIQYVSPDGTVEDGPVVTVPAPGSAHRGRNRPGT